MRRLLVGDLVEVISGNDAGKRGKVSRVLEEGRRVVVEGVNNVKRHIRAAQGRPGGILEVEAPIFASKVMLIDPESDRPTRVRHKIENGKKVRVAAKKSAAIILPQQS
ncbi:MAG: 50S ribosomal protein L24 [Sorangiineae bacterium]|nr:50S ribosomal protein L24 [Sorangiineae bacterium]